MPDDFEFPDPALPRDSDVDEFLIFGSPATRRKFLKQIAGTSAAITFGPGLVTRMHASTAGSSAAVATPTSTEALVPTRWKINGKDYELRIDPRVSLLDLLREHLGFTGSKKGCDHGQCGACTVLVNGRRINSCLSLAVVHDGAEITTIEGLANGEELHPMQAAFLEHDGFQCGYCTPGQICSAVACVQEGHAKDDAEIREWMSGNICRCGAYPNIVAAIKEVQGKTGGATRS
jgi:xanthine dehydrogenase YagT iron-sulfur-binding subunit